MISTQAQLISEPFTHVYPPLNQMARGSLSGSFSDSTNLQAFDLNDAHARQRMGDIHTDAHQ
jgi:hypothetical protein